jgi:biotin-dependent carboxylase-like uncharacterized protein
MIEVLRGGLLTSVQDGGRRGHAAVGVGRAGAMDRHCAMLANWLAGNTADAALLEISLTGPRLRFARAACIALAGADCEAQLDGAPLPAWRPVPVSAGAVLDCGRVLHGARAYLAISGGIPVEPVLGSRSMDVNAGLGPNGGRPLRSGDTLPLPQSPALRLRRASTWSLAPRPWFDPSPTRVLRLLRGSHHAALDAASQAALVGERFRIAPESNRVGARLRGAPLHLQQALELVSAAVTAGTLQLPPGGQPIMLGAEHPTTGGYPRIAHLIDVDQPHLAQRRPGDSVVFRLVELDEAQALRQRRDQALQRLHDTLRQRLRESGCDA